MLSANVIDTFLWNLLAKQSGPKRFWVSNMVSSTISQTKEFGLDEQSTHTCTNEYKQRLKDLLTLHKEIFWPIRVKTKCAKGHWVLTMVYPKPRKIITVDSSIKTSRLKKIHKV